MMAPSEAEKPWFWAWLHTLDAAVGPDLANWLHDVRSNRSINGIIAETVSRASDECVLFSAAFPALVPPEVRKELRPNHFPLVVGPGRIGGWHQMLGRGRNIQGAPEYMAPTHVLLMQLDTDEWLGWMMADCGALQYWIHIEDLRAKDFSRVEVTLEGS